MCPAWMTISSARTGSSGARAFCAIRIDVVRHLCTTTNRTQRYKVVNGLANKKPTKSAMRITSSVSNRCCHLIRVTMQQLMRSELMPSYLNLQLHQQLAMTLHAIQKRSQIFTHKGQCGQRHSSRTAQQCLSNCHPAWAA